MQIRWQGLPTRDKPWSPTNNDDFTVCLFLLLSLSLSVILIRVKHCMLLSPLCSLARENPKKNLYRVILISF